MDKALARCHNIADLERMAHRRLPRVVSDFLSGAAEDESALRENKEVFQRYRLCQEVLTGRKSASIAIELFGEKFATPFLIAPTGGNGLFWSHGDLALARAAGATGVGMVTSCASSDSLEAVSKESSGTKWFQLYPWGNQQVWGRLIERAREAGYKALVVTVDSVIPSKRERDLRHGFAHEVRMSPRIVLDGLMHPRWLASVWLRHGNPRVENVAEFASPGANAAELTQYIRLNRPVSLGWTDIAWMKKQWAGPLLVKGVLAARDVTRAVEAGADGIVVSNHGGRSMDSAPATLDALPAILEKAGSSLTILVDGGFRRGSDVIKALALGANAVLVGRATLFGLAAAGEPGVTRAIEILHDECTRVLSQLGCGAISDLGLHHLLHTGRSLDHCGLPQRLQ